MEPVGQTCGVAGLLPLKEGAADLKQGRSSRDHRYRLSASPKDSVP